MNILNILLLFLSLTNSPYVSQIQSAETGATPPTTLASSQFSICDSQEKFSNQVWYLPFILGITQTSFYTEESANRMWEMNKELYASPDDVVQQLGMVKPTNITHVCYAPNTNIVIASVSDYMVRGKLMVYDATPMIFSELPLDATSSPTGESFIGFGVQKGTILPVITRFGDGPMMTETTYDLDLTKTTLIPRSSKSCLYDDATSQSVCKETEL